MSLIDYVTRIRFADHVLEDALSEELRQLRIRHPLVLTDRATGATATDAEDPFERLVDALPAGCRVERLTVDQATETAARAAMTKACEAGCDAVIGLGGAVALGLARRVGSGLRAPRPHRSGTPTEFDDWPVISIPTTTETVGIGAMPAAIGESVGRPGNLSAASMVPTVVLCDPTLTTGNGPEATAAAGMDALTHCLEAYLGTGWNPPADGIALEGVRRAGANIARATWEGNDIEARREMLAAALCAGLSAQKGLGAVHALAHALEDEAPGTRPRERIRHGWLHASLLRPVLRFNAPAVAHRYDALLQALGASAGADLSDVIEALGTSLAMPIRLCPRDLGTSTPAHIARRAEEDPATRTNPRHVKASDYQRILEDAFESGTARVARSGLV